MSKNLQVIRRVRQTRHVGTFTWFEKLGQHVYLVPLVAGFAFVQSIKQFRVQNLHVFVAEVTQNKLPDVVA